MKLIIAVLLLTIGAFAQNTTYKDGTDCYCDSINIVDSYDSYDDTTGWKPVSKTDDPDIQRFMIYMNSGEVTESYHITNTPYKNGKINGYEHYYNDSVMVGFTEYSNGIVLSSKWFYVSGELNEINTYKNGKISSSVLYYMNGSTWREESYTNGNLNGVTKWYFESGKIAGTATYKNGKLVGYKKCTDGRFGNESLDCLK